MTKEELSKRIGELYNVEMIKGAYVGYDGKYGVILKDVLLIDDSARMFELAVENGLNISTCGSENCTVTEMNRTQRYVKDFSVAKYADHPTKLEATLYAIGLALVKKKEMA